MISSKYAKISFYQADPDASVYYDLNNGNYLNTSNPALCALLDSQMNKFDSTKLLNVNVSLNGVDYALTDTQSWDFYYYYYYYYYYFFFLLFIFFQLNNSVVIILFYLVINGNKNLNQQAARKLWYSLKRKAPEFSSVVGRSSTTLAC